MVSRSPRVAFLDDYAYTAVSTRAPGAEGSGDEAEQSAAENTHVPVDPEAPSLHDTDWGGDGEQGNGGPDHFIFSGWYLALSGVAVLINTVCLVCETGNPSLKADLLPVDRVCLVYYVLDVVLRASVLQRNFLCRPACETAWNWFDTLLTMSGVMDEYLRMTGKHDLVGGPLVLKVVQSLRILRLFRVMRLVRVFCAADTSWADGARFQGMMAGAIALNAIVMGAETDIPWNGWYWVEQGFLVVFLFELLLQIKRQGLRFLSKNNPGVVWNFLDLLIVGGAVFEMWCMPLYEYLDSDAGDLAEKMSQLMMAFQMMRLLRILRLVKLVKVVKPLYHLALGLVTAMQSIFWVLVLTSVLLYAFAIMATRLVGHGLLFKAMAIPRDDESVLNVMNMYPSTIDSMFQLFTVMNGNEASLEPLFDVVPGTRVFYAVFMVLSSWALLSILTAVVSENMITTTQAAERECYEEERRLKRIKIRQDLVTAFREKDEDNSGTLCEDEFNQIITVPAVQKQLEEMVDIDVKDIFDFLEVDGQILMEDFVDGLLRDVKPVSERSVMRLEKRLRNIDRGLRGQISLMVEEVQRLQKDLRGPPDAGVLHVKRFATDPLFFPVDTDNNKDAESPLVQQASGQHLSQIARASLDAQTLQVPHAAPEPQIYPGLKALFDSQSSTPRAARTVDPDDGHAPLWPTGLPVGLRLPPDVGAKTGEGKRETSTIREQPVVGPDGLDEGEEGKERRCSQGSVMIVPSSCSSRQTSQEPTLLDIRRRTYSKAEDRFVIGRGSRSSTDASQTRVVSLKDVHRLRRCCSAPSPGAGGPGTAYTGRRRKKTSQVWSEPEPWPSENPGDSSGRDDFSPNREVQSRQISPGRCNKVPPLLPRTNNGKSQPDEDTAQFQQALQVEVHRAARTEVSALAEALVAATRESLAEMLREAYQSDRADVPLPTKVSPRSRDSPAPSLYHSED